MQTEILVELIDVNPLNNRIDMGDIDGLAASILEIGLIQPITVQMAPNDRYLLIAGHRRLEAHKRAGLQTIQAIIAADMSEADQILHIQAENDARKDATALERAKGYQTALALGVPPERVAKAAAAGSADRVSKAARALEIIDPEKYTQISMEQMEALVEFEDDLKARKKLLGAIVAGRNFEYEYRHLIEERDRAAELARVTSELEQAGVRVIREPKNGGYSYDETVRRLEQLDIEPETHADCPGHCAWVSKWSNKPIYGCDKFTLHADDPGAADAEKQLREAAKAQEEAERAEREAAWGTATKVRHEWLAENLKNGALLEVIAGLVLGDDRDNPLGSFDSPLAALVAQALGRKHELSNGHLSLVWQAPGYVSETLWQAIRRHSDAIAYLETLEANGYVLTEPERAYVTNAKAFIAREAALDAEAKAKAEQYDCDKCAQKQNDWCEGDESGHPNDYGMSSDGEFSCCFEEPEDDAEAIEEVD